MSEPLSAPAPTQPCGETNSNPRALAVDDQADSLRLLQLRLAAGGIECVAFSDGATALKYLEQNLVDVVILDVMMPQMDGYEVCRRLKADPRTQDIPVIFLTAKFEAADKVQGLEIGGHDYLSKPIQQPELLARTRAAVRIKKMQDQLREQLQLQQQIHQLHQRMVGEHWQKTFGQLAASLAHEINNPLAAALGTVQLLRMSERVDQELRQRLETVDTSLQRAGQKLRSLLLIAQSDRYPQRIVLAGLVRDVVTLLNYQLVMNKVTLNLQLDAQCEWEGVSGDLARILLYILNNAVEAVSGRDKPTITITLEPRGTRHCITVADNGSGIDPVIRSRVFEPFFTTKAPPHNGIGLYLAGEMAKSIGCTIELQEPSAEAANRLTVCLPVNSRVVILNDI